MSIFNLMFLFCSECSACIHDLQDKVNTNRRNCDQQKKSGRYSMRTRTKMNTPVGLLSVILLSTALLAPTMVEARRGHHHHHHHTQHHHHKHHHHHHKHQHHYNTQNIYYSQPYYRTAPVYGVTPGRYFLGVNTGNVGFVLSGY